jgi:hypothetical protein
VLLGLLIRSATKDQGLHASQRCHFTRRIQGGMGPGAQRGDGHIVGVGQVTGCSAKFHRIDIGYRALCDKYAIANPPDSSGPSVVENS